MGGRFDLHLHTKASDGLLEPEELVRRAAEMGLFCIAVTDHDTADGVERAQAEGARLGLPVIAGAEFTAAFDGELHILGYGMDLRSAAHRRFIAEQRARREERNAAMLKRLAELGVALPEEFLPGCAGGAYGRMHMARGLVAAGRAQSIAQAFERYLSHGAAAYAPRRKFSSAELMEAILGSGGQAVLAHPGRMALGWQRLEELVGGLAGQGLAGIEVFYPTHTAEEVRLYLRMAEERGLVATYGSDWHGSGAGMAYRFEDFRIPQGTYRWVEALAGRQEVGQ